MNGTALTAASHSPPHCRTKDFVIIHLDDIIDPKNDKVH